MFLLRFFHLFFASVGSLYSCTSGFRRDVGEGPEDPSCISGTIAVATRVVCSLSDTTKKENV